MDAQELDSYRRQTINMHSTSNETKTVRFVNVNSLIHHDIHGENFTFIFIQIYRIYLVIFA